MNCTKELDQLMQGHEECLIDHLKNSQVQAQDGVAFSRQLLMDRMDHLDGLMKKQLLVLDKLSEDHIQFQSETKELVESLTAKTSHILSIATDRYHQCIDKFASEMNVIIEKTQKQLEE
eukprot:NODE_25_length_35605_cov_0.353461.p18 type:complete len:119 gc:universal NODE_25_length_35605_cov_0.353461:474-830(+)